MYTSNVNTKITCVISGPTLHCRAFTATRIRTWEQSPFPERKMPFPERKNILKLRSIRGIISRYVP